MNKTTSYMALAAAGVATMAVLAGCASENPFDSEGYGTVRLHTVVNNATTRAISDEEKTTLEKKCVIYISDKKRAEGKSLIFKETGTGNIPAQINLPVSSYAAEAWSGDSVAADKAAKFYRGYQNFEITKGSQTNVALNCRILNTIVSFNFVGIDDKIMKDDYKITVASANGSLEFGKSDVDDKVKGYFMLHQDNLKVLNDILEKITPGTESKNVATDQTLEFTITGTRADGNQFKVSQTIKNVKPAFHYIFSMKYDSGTTPDNPEGGAMFDISIEESEITEEPTITVSAPTISGLDFDIKSTRDYTSAIPEETIVQICAHEDISAIYVTKPWLETPTELTNILDTANAQKYADKGITLSGTVVKEGIATNYIIFKKSVFESIPSGSYTIDIKAVDKAGLPTEAKLTIKK